jgi:hypothetical protein
MSGLLELRGERLVNAVVGVHVVGSGDVQGAEYDVFAVGFQGGD